MGRRTLFVLVALALNVSATIPSAGQTSTGEAGLRAVISACQQSDAACQNATNAYLELLSSAGLSDADRNAALVDLVVALATKAEVEEGCSGDQKRLATAISLTGTFSNSSEQRNQIDDIATAVANCQEIQTAALASVETDSDANSVGSQGSAN